MYNIIILRVIQTTRGHDLFQRLFILYTHYSYQSVSIFSNFVAHPSYQLRPQGLANQYCIDNYYTTNSSVYSAKFLLLCLYILAGVSAEKCYLLVSAEKCYLLVAAPKCFSCIGIYCGSTLQALQFQSPCIAVNERCNLQFQLCCYAE